MSFKNIKNFGHYFGHHSGRFFGLIAIVTCISYAQSAWAQPDAATQVDILPGQVIVQGGHSGAFGDKDNDFNGIFVEVLNSQSSPTGKKLLITWYAFFNGQQVWLLAVGDVIEKDGEFVAEMTTWIYEGNDFPPNYDGNQTIEIVWGQIIFRFIGCDGAILSWTSVIDGFQDGEVEFERVTSIADTFCDPALGMGPLKDDHADSWPQATRLPLPGITAKVIEGVIDDAHDVDVFILTLTQTTNVSFYTLEPTKIQDTKGKLYRLINNSEMLIAENDDADDEDDFGPYFKIEETLEPGTYTLHVSGQIGMYRLHIQLGNEP